jgi:hypothetical protein
MAPDVVLRNDNILVVLPVPYGATVLEEPWPPYTLIVFALFYSPKHSVY